MLFLIITSALCLWIGYYLYKTYLKAGYWDSKGVPNLKGQPILGLQWHASDPNGAWFPELPKYTKKFGKMWGYQEGATSVLVISDQKTVKELLHTRFDDFQQRKPMNPLFQQEADDPLAHLAAAWGYRWKRLRSLVSPQFSNSSLKKVLPTVKSSTQEILRLIAEKEGQEIDIHDYWQELTADIITRVAMGQKESTMFRNAYIKELKFILGRDPRDPFFILACIFPGMKKYLRAFFIFLGKIFMLAGMPLIVQIKNAVVERKKERAQGGATSEEKELVDYIDLFLDAEAEVDLKAEENADMRQNHVVRHLVEDEIVMQCFIFLLTGYDTTANALSYTSWYLTKYPEIQRRVQEEIEQVCTEKEITYEQLGELKFFDMVAKEVLRLHPLGTMACCRVAERDCELAGVKLEKGDAIQIDAYYIQRDPEIWGDDAEEFNPDRWQNLTSEQKEAYLAFGAGPRQCVGLKLAYMEEKLALASLLRDYNLEAGPNFEKSLHLLGWMTVAPKSVTVVAKKRTG
ncbi:unnamed protein product, partial [Mesorhabditis spiculigera]